MCSNDDNVEVVVGNAFRQTIHEIWHGEKMNEIRRIHRQKDGFKSIPSCARCYYPRKTMPDEKTVINNRVIFIQNYINRKQVIGE